MGNLLAAFCFGPFAILGILTLTPIPIVMDNTSSFLEKCVALSILLVVLVPGHKYAFRIFKRIKRMESHENKMGYSRGTWLVLIPISYLIGIGIMVLVLIDPK